MDLPHTNYSNIFTTQIDLEFSLVEGGKSLKITINHSKSPYMCIHLSMVWFLPRWIHWMAPLQTLPSLKRTWPLKMDGWNTTFLLRWPIFRCYVSFREGKEQKNLETNDVALKCSSQYTNANSQPYRGMLQLKLILETWKIPFQKPSVHPLKVNGFSKNHTGWSQRRSSQMPHPHVWHICCAVTELESPHGKQDNAANLSFCFLIFIILIVLILGLIEEFYLEYKLYASKILELTIDPKP